MAAVEEGVADLGPDLAALPLDDRRRRRLERGMRKRHDMVFGPSSGR